MKNILALASSLLIFILMSCETVINPKLEQAPPVLAVDAWLTSGPNKQTIKLTTTQAYFDNYDLSGVRGAIVQVTNTTNGRNFRFFGSDAGVYQWTPSNSTDSLGQSGDEFALSIIVGSEEFIASSTMGRVPAIDSITFRFEKASSFFPDQYIAEFWATDPIGSGDTYWIKAWKNDTLLLKPSEINIAFDAGFSPGGSFDGVTFITPIRQGIDPSNTDSNGKQLSPYQISDSVYVEIHSISNAAFNFLNEVKTQTDRPGGFGELFASPFANVSTNIANTNPNGSKAVGFFNIGGVAGKGKKLTE